MKVPGTGLYSIQRRFNYKPGSIIHRGDACAGQVIKECLDMLSACFKQCGLTQAKLAERMGRHPNYVAGYLNRRVRVIALGSVAELFYHMGYRLEINLVPLYKYNEQRLKQEIP